jgi:hypothetical protein
MKKLIFALIAAATAVGSAQAGTPYVGVGIASADHNYSLPGTTNGSTDGYKASGKVFGGVDIDPMWGVEVGYTDFKKSNYNYTNSTTNTAGNAQSDGNSFYVAGKLTAPINEQFSVVGKLGAARNKTTLSSATEPGFNSSDSKTEVYAGVGLQYNLNQKVALTADYERYGKSKDFGAKPDVLTIGAKYAF